MRTSPRIARLHSLSAVAAVALLAAACDSGISPDTVAVAGDHTLQAEELAGILQNRDSSIPGNAEVVRTVADLWVDYTLLAEATLEDPNFSDLDVASILQPELEQEVILQLRDQAIEVDTVFTEEELRTAYEQEGGGLQIQARHILFTFPPEATEAQRDSVESLAAEVRERAVSGEEFASLAESYSQDPGSAAQGGDLGTFGRGQMVPAFEETAFTLEEGEISELVESPYGIHIIRVEERILPPFDESRAQFERQLVNRTVAVAESTFIAGIVEPAELTVADGASSVIRELIETPDAESVSPGQELVTYQGGAFTAGDFRSFIRSRPPANRSQMQQGSDPQLEQLLRNLAQRKLLLAEARQAGLEIDPIRRDTLVQRFRSTLDDLVSNLGFTDIAPAEGQTEDEAVQERVRAVLDQIVRGEINIVPLGALSFVLRDDARSGVYDEGVQAAVDALSAGTGTAAPNTSGPPSPATPPNPATPPASTGDAGGGGA